MSGNLTKIVKVIVAGDSGTLQSALDKASQKSQSVASQIKGHFTNLFATLNASGALGGLAGQFTGILASLDQIDLKTKGIGNKLAGAGVGLAGTGGALTMLGAGDKAAEQQLKQAFANIGLSAEDYKKQIEDAVNSQAKFGYTAEQTDQGLQRLVTATHDPKEAFKDLGIAANLAAEKHEDLGSAVNQMAMIVAGKGTKVLQQLGIQNQVVSVSASTVASATKAEAKAHDALGVAQQKVNDILAKYPDAANPASKAHAQYEAAVKAAQKANDVYQASVQHVADVTNQFQHPLNAAQQNIKAVADATKGQAAAAADTWAGKLRALRAEVENHVAQFGQKYGPAITAAGVGMTVLGTTISATKGVMDMFRSTTEATTAAQEVLTGAEAASGAAADGLAAGETAADAAGMPLILTIGLIVLAVAAVVAIIYELVKHWKEVFDTIKHVVSDAVDWIKGHWELLVAIFTGPIGAVVMLVVHFRDQIIGFFDDLWHGSIGKVEQFGTDIVNFFTGLPGQLASVGAHMWDWMLDGLKLIEHGIADIWNNSIGSLSFHVPSWVPGIGGDGFSVPKIPYLALGGTAASGMPYIVGERGPEMFVPQQAGTVIPHGQLAAYLAGGRGEGGGGKHIEVTQNIYLPTGTPEEFGDETTWGLSRLIA